MIAAQRGLEAAKYQPDRALREFGEQRWLDHFRVANWWGWYSINKTADKGGGG